MEKKLKKTINSEKQKFNRLINNNHNNEIIMTPITIIMMIKLITING